MTILYVECPTTDVSYINPQDSTIFLAGGITGCEDWQSRAVGLFDDLEDAPSEYDKSQNILLLNPRRANFDVTKPQMTKEQIIWEYNMLSCAEIHLFWFPEETLCPITLYELGKSLQTHGLVFIGCHPNYQRKLDVEIQAKLIHPDIVIHDNLADLVAETYKVAKTLHGV